MSRGGPRPGSGPAPDPTSARSDARGVSVTKLPARGYKGYIPKFPLPRRTDEASTDRIAEREVELWKQLWRTPQAAAWHAEAWRQLSVAHYVRISVKVESGDGSASDIAQMRGLASDIGLSPQGMRFNGWAIDAADEVQKKRAQKQQSEPKAPPKRRLRAVGD
jgi:hypothetical protein